MPVQDVAGWIGVLAALGAAYKAFSVSRQVTEVHLTMNSRLDALLEVTKQLAHAEGVTEGLHQRRSAEGKETEDARL